MQFALLESQDKGACTCSRENNGNKLGGAWDAVVYLYKGDTQGGKN